MTNFSDKALLRGVFSSCIFRHVQDQFIPRFEGPDQAQVGVGRFRTRHFLHGLGHLLHMHLDQVRSGLLGMGGGDGLVSEELFFDVIFSYLSFNQKLGDTFRLSQRMNTTYVIPTIVNISMMQATTMVATLPQKMPTPL